MAFVAVCPHCRTARFRAPDGKRGTEKTCPKCGQTFLLAPADEPPDAPATGDAAAPTVASPADTAYPDDALRLALVAIVLVGAAGLATLFPYGRIVAVVVAGVGVVVAGLSLLGLERRAWLGWAGVGLNAAVVLLAVFLPSWVGLSTWVPAADPDDSPRRPLSVGLDGSPPRPADWVDASAAVWEHGDIRIGVTSARVGPDPAATTPARRKERFLFVTVKVSNVGFTRGIDVPEWAADGPALTTAGGQPVAARGAADPPGAVTVYPGKSAERVLRFDLPPDPKRPQDLRLEVPPGAVGGTEPARFRLPAAMIDRRDAAPPRALP